MVKRVQDVTSCRRFSQRPTLNRRDLLRVGGAIVLSYMITNVGKADTKPVPAIASRIVPLCVMHTPSTHRKITEEALNGIVAPFVLGKIVEANLGQDTDEAMKDPLNHGDNDEIEATISRINDWIKSAQDIMNSEQSEQEIDEALTSLGKSFHAIQDLVSHSDYVEKMTADGEYESPAEVPIPNFFKNGRPKGIITGTYDPKNPYAAGTPEKPTHWDINKDLAPHRDNPSRLWSPRSRVLVPGMDGKNMYDVARDIAVRETQELYGEFLKGITNEEGKNRWNTIAALTDM